MERRSTLASASETRSRPASILRRAMRRCSLSFCSSTRRAASSSEAVAAFRDDASAASTCCASSDGALVVAFRVVAFRLDMAFPRIASLQIFNRQRRRLFELQQFPILQRRFASTRNAKRSAEKSAERFWLREVWIQPTGRTLAARRPLASLVTSNSTFWPSCNER